MMGFVWGIGWMRVYECPDGHVWMAEDEKEEG